MSAPYLASDVMDESASLLNDTAKTQFTYTAQLPYLKRANEILENLMISWGVSVQRQTSAVITVTTSSSNIDLSGLSGYPSDMLLPIRLLETDLGSTVFGPPMTEKEWEPEITPTSTLQFWVFRNNKIYTPGVTTSRLVKIDYWRQLTVITSQSSNEEVGGGKTWLAAKTAELCARYIGQNKEIADDLFTIEVIPAQDTLERIYNKNSQGSARGRRRRFRRPRVSYSR